MLEKPAISEDRIVNRLWSCYGLKAYKITFLPLGADLNTAVYCVEALGGLIYFLKLRSGEFLQASVTVPKYLANHGIRQVIPPIPGRTRRLWYSLPPYKMILYPYVEGCDGFERKLTDRQWEEFGAAMKSFHTTVFPAAILGGVPREEFSSRWRGSIVRFLEPINTERINDPVAMEVANYLKPKAEEIIRLVRRTEQLAGLVKEQPRNFILCHGDIHAWNLLVTADGQFFMVDWDTLILAPRERDLMFVGGGLGGRDRTPQEEEALFYRGYGPVDCDPSMLAYYRYERIIEDLAIFCEQIFLADEGDKDRRQAFEYLKSYFLPGSPLDIALNSDGITSYYWQDHHS